MYSIQAIPAFNDNYIWCLSHDGRAVVVDPGDAAPVLKSLQEWQLTLSGIMVTHHHFDHVGGLQDLLTHSKVPVYGPAESSPLIDHPVAGGDHCAILGLEFAVYAVPGHTLDHIAYYHPAIESQPALFCGDTLFAGGCGRLFEGSPEQMYHSLQQLAALPASTRVFCAHEYTEANLRFAAAVEPENAALRHRQQQVAALRADDQPTVPSQLSEELATNPFLRCEEKPVQDAVAKYANMAALSAVDTFAAVRKWKDSF